MNYYNYKLHYGRSYRIIFLMVQRATHHSQVIPHTKLHLSHNRFLYECKCLRYILYIRHRIFKFVIMEALFFPILPRWALARLFYCSLSRLPNTILRWKRCLRKIAISRLHYFLNIWFHVDVDNSKSLWSLLSFAGVYVCTFVCDKPVETFSLI